MRYHRVVSTAHVHVSLGRVLIASAVTMIAGVVELWVSRTAGSLFLVADVVHLLAHLGIFVVLMLPARGSHAAREDVVTCAVLLLVVGIAVEIGVASVRGLLHPGEPPPAGALLFSLVGLFANLLSAWLFRDPARRRWSFRAALAHELSDASMTVAGLLGAGAIAMFGWRRVDPSISLGIALWLTLWAGRLLISRIRRGSAAWDRGSRSGR